MNAIERLQKNRPEYLATLQKLRDEKAHALYLKSNQFKYFDGLTRRQIDVANSAVLPLSEAKRLSLVKAAKSPTKEKAHKTHVCTGEIPEFTQGVVPKTPEQAPGAFTVVQFREWSDEYRIRTRIETSNAPPPIPEGGRESKNLTMRAAKKIADSCDYVSRKLGGYKTFLTLTFTAEQRKRIDAEETSIQKEVSRFCDGLTKAYARGWQGYQGTLLYVWVAEVPENERGEENPHVHMLLNWRVDYRDFDDWADYVESLWGCGFAHLEKIKDTTAAAAYMMKAAGYLCKAQGKDDQGKVRGNRYNMSAAARAPEWETISETQLHIMGRLIADVNAHLTEKYGDQYQMRKSLNKAIDQHKKGSRIRVAIGRQLQKVRQRLDKLPIVASKYQIILKGRDAYETFMGWCRADHAVNHDWLPDKGRGERYEPTRRPDTLWFDKFKSMHYWRRALRKMPTLCDIEWQSLLYDSCEPAEREAFGFL